MTSRDLVHAAIEHRETPRVPYSFLTTGETNDQIRKELGVEDVEAWLNNDIQSVGVPWWGWDALGSDWRGAATPTTPATVMGSGSYGNLRDNIREMRDRSDKYFLVMIWGSHFEKANSARGIENFLCDIAADYAFAKRLCTSIIDKNMVMLENFLNIDEIDGVLLGSDWGSQRGSLMSPAVWDELIRPGEQREYDLVHSYGKHVWVHSCGRVDALIPRLVEMGLDALNPVQPECMDLATLKSDFGADLAFWGGIGTQNILPYGTPDEVRAEARATRDLMARDGGYILSPSQALQGDVPVENIQALLEVARESTPIRA